jgi:ATP-dependent Clp protease ATP-binding subunit ClpX
MKGESMTTLQVKQNKVNIITAREIRAWLQSYIYGNTDLVNKLSKIGSAYSNMLHSNLDKNIDLKDLPNLNMFITGASGTGKTYGVKMLAEYLNIPYFRVDCSNLEASPGRDSVHISEVLKKWGSYDVNGRIGGILFLDEFDKLSGSGKAHNTGYMHLIQQGLLDLIDGDAEFNGIKYNNLLIIASGSFQTARDMIEAIKEEKEKNIERKNKTDKENTQETEQIEVREIGFLSSLETKTINKTIKDKSKTVEEMKELEDYEELLNTDLENGRELLTQGGIMTELAGRFLTFAETEQITVEQVIKLIDSSTSIYMKYVRLNDNTPFLSDEDKRDIADKALKSKAGIRELNTLIYDKYADTLGLNDDR